MLQNSLFLSSFIQYSDLSISVELQVGDCVKLSSVYFAASSLGSMVQRMKVLLMVRWIRYINFQVLPLRSRPKKIKNT